MTHKEQIRELVEDLRKTNPSDRVCDMTRTFHTGKAAHKAADLIEKLAALPDTLEDEADEIRPVGYECGYELGQQDGLQTSASRITQAFKEVLGDE